MAGLSATGYFQMSALLGVLAGGFWADRWSRRTPLARIYVPALGLTIAGAALFLAERLLSRFSIQSRGAAPLPSRAS